MEASVDMVPSVPVAKPQGTQGMLLGRPRLAREAKVSETFQVCFSGASHMVTPC